VSVEAITWALKQPIKSSPAKFVLVALANCASGDTFVAYPSIAYLADTTAQDRKTVINNIRKLLGWGLIEDTGARVGTTKQIPVYRLRGPDLLASIPKPGQFQKRNGSENGTVPNPPRNSTVLPPKQSQKRDTEPSEPLEPSIDRGNAAGLLAAGIQKALGPTCGVTSLLPVVIEAAAAGVTAAQVIETHKAYPHKPARYAVQVALSQTREAKSRPSTPNLPGNSYAVAPRMSASDRTRAAIAARLAREAAGQGPSA
jgi:hypothetical protein